MKLKKYFLFLLIVTSFLSCTFKFTPLYNAGVASQMKTGSELTAKLYDGVIKSPDKTYTSVDSFYTMVNAVIVSIKTQNDGLPKSIGKSAISTKINHLQSMFTQYRNMHKVKGSLNTAELIQNRDVLKAQWKSLQATENDLK